MAEKEIKKVGCLFCHFNCGLLIHVEDGRITKIEGDPENYYSRGYICTRAKHAIDWLYHPDQLTYPLKRVGERGEGRWERISWDRALDEIAKKLKELKEKYGPETLAVGEGTYRTDQLWAVRRFLNLFGSPFNLHSPGIICACNDMIINIALLGYIAFRGYNWAKANCIVFWGSNPSESEHPVTWLPAERRLDAKPRPKLIVIDPRLTEAARRADIWLQIRPGSDVALGLAWLNVIINEELYDKEFVKNWCYGFDKLKERVQDYPPEKVEKITWIPADRIIESARMYATNKPAVLHSRVALDQIGSNTTRWKQTAVILRAVTGNIRMSRFGLEPRNPFTDEPWVRWEKLELPEKCPPEQRQKQLGSDRFKLMTWPGWELISEPYEKVHGVPFNQCWTMFVTTPLIWRAIATGKPYPIKALITYASNPLVSAPNTKLVYKALKSPNLELHVVTDFWMTPTAELADYILPCASWLERPLCMSIPGTDFILGGVRAIKPLGERRTDYEFFRGLGIRLGQDEKEYWPWKTYEEFIEYRLKPLGITYEAWSKKPWTEHVKWKEYEETGFATPTGKVELYSTIFKKLGYDPLPFYEEPPESPFRTPEVAKEYPLILITGGRFKPMFHSEHRQIGIGLRKMHPDPIMQIHPETACKFGIVDGAWTWIETRRGRIKQKARLFEGIDPRVIHIQHDWWFPEMPGEEPWLHGVWESNANVLTIDDPDSLDQIIGNWCNRGLLCKVYPVKELQDK